MFPFRVPAFRVLTLVAPLAAVACTHESWTAAPYILPTPVYGEPLAQSFRVRYSEFRNTDEELRELIAAQCAPGTKVARVWPTRYAGSVLHPHEVQVSCGYAPDPVPIHRGMETPETRLIDLKPTSGS